MTDPAELLERRFQREPIEGEQEARARSWPIVAAAFEERAADPRQTTRWRPLVAAVAALALLLGLSLTPAGADVRRWIGEAIAPGVENAKPTLTRLPSDGSLLVVSNRGPWIVRADGSQRFLGHYEQASWSPNGLFVIAARGRQLTAITPGGEPRWSLSRPEAISEPRWSGVCCRIAYLSGGQLRVVDGDGTGDERIAGAAAVAPAWRSRSDAELAYVDRVGAVRIVDVETRERSARVALGSPPLQLVWSADGRRLLALARTSAYVLDERGRILARREWPDRRRLVFAAYSRRSQSFALLSERPGPGAGPSSTVSLVEPKKGALAETEIFSGPGRFGHLAFSPDDGWLLVGWRDADQWLFIRPDRVGTVRAVGDIAAQFAPGETGTGDFPRLSGWCCPPG